MPLTTWPTAIVEIGFSSNTGNYLVLDDPVTGLLNTGQLATGAGVVDLWTDVTQWVGSYSWHRGRRRPIDQFTAGSASVTVRNMNRQFSPENLSGPYVTGGVTTVRPGTPLRIRATWAGVTYPRWYGYIEAITETIDPRFPDHTDITFDCTDGFGRIARFTGTPQTPQGASELSGPRIHRILTNAGWDMTLRDIDDGQSTMQATTLGDNALTELQTVADSENGEIYMAPDGKFTFDQRYIRMTDTRSNTSQVTFADDGARPGYRSYTPTFDRDLLINRAQYTRTGGAVQIVNDTVSQADQGIVVDEKTGLFNETDTDVLSAAGWVVARFRNAEQRVDEITLVPMSDPAVLWPQALGRQIRDRITFQRTPASGTAISQDVFIEGISESVDVSNTDWVVQFNLSSAVAWLPFMVLDSTTRGLLDTGVLAY